MAEEYAPWLLEALQLLPGCTRDYKAEWGWHRFMVGGKLFAALCCPGPEHKAYAGRPLLTLKCEPAFSELLRRQYPDITPGFYMDKRCWISVFLDGAVPQELLRGLITDSYTLVLHSLTKKLQKSITEGTAP